MICSGRRVACELESFAAETAAFMVETMIKDRPHRLGLVYVNQPLYFVTFATRDRKRIASLHRAQLVIERYGHCATSKFNVALGRYVIMPDHVHLFVRRSKLHTLVMDRWFKARDVCGPKIATALAACIFRSHSAQRRKLRREVELCSR